MIAPKTLGELEHELAVRGARMVVRCEPGKARHRVLVTLSAEPVDPKGDLRQIQISIVGETLEGAIAGALARLDSRLRIVERGEVVPNDPIPNG
jgi:hypothetical protein